MKAIDYEKRRRVMQRSKELGHCICDTRRTCPCDVFHDQGICPCAGERPEPLDLSQVRLTEHVRNAGCASKIAPADLEAVITRLPAVTDPAVVCGLAAGDDAAIYRIAEGLHLVQTVDVFTPCVDDPELFGRICAANCLSDVYAMGGQPRTALSIVGFPSESMDGEVLYRMLSGAMQVLAEAGVALVGGHSVKEEEIKLGFAITGTIDPVVATSLDRARVGDVLVLTKPLGTGVLTFGRQVGRVHPEGLAAAAASMAALNRAAADSMIEARVSACTDITGFGLFGHLIRLLRQGNLVAQVYADALPAFPGALEALAQNVIPGAIERNREFVGNDLVVSDGIAETRVNLGFDAQTSGGLLITVPAERLSVLMAALARRDVKGHVVGRILQSGPPHMVLTNTPAGEPSVEPALVSQSPAPAPEAVGHVAGPSGESDHECCAEFFSKEATAKSAPTKDDSLQAFGALMRSAEAAGAVDEKTKELILFSLVLLAKCGPCFAAHYERAQELGITQAELDEAAWCAIAMGGAPVRMFYLDCLRQAQARGGSGGGS